MIKDNNRIESEIDCKEWYDFMGQFANVMPPIHMGGSKATKDLLDLCHLDKENYVLDIGCGGGHTACRIFNEYSSQVIGIDFSERMIAKSQERARKQDLEGKIEFQVGSALELPFDDRMFNVIIFESVLTAIEDKRGAMKEALRVLQSGGIIAANETVFDSSAPPELLELLDEYPSINGHLTPQSLKDLFAESGLQIINMIEVRGSETPKATKEMGLRGIISFVFRSSWKIIGKMLTDSRFRKVQKIDKKITKMLQENGGYALIIGQKPSE